MRKEKNLKILPLILVAFILTIFISGCRKNENTASSVPASFEIAQSGPASDDNSNDIVSSEIIVQEETSSVNTASQNSSSQQNFTQSSSSEKSSSQSGSSKYTVSSQVSSKNSTTTAHTHSYKTEKVDATCTGAGYIKNVCECGNTYTEQTVKALGHSFGEWQVIVNPSNTAGGVKQRTCSRCGCSDMQHTDKINLTDAEMCMEVFRLVNEERAKQGLSALTYNTEAQAAADKRANEIKSAFSHTRPDGRNCFTVFDDVGLKYMVMGENIAKGQTTPDHVMNSWMNSSGHRANILSEDFTSMVVGFTDNHWVQLFMSK